MTATLPKEGCFSGAPVHTPPVLVSERVLVPEGLLSGGEIVLLAVKPSLWFIVLRSGPWLAVSFLAGALSWYLYSQGIQVEASRLALQLAILVGLARVSVAMFQWASKLYVLTNRRVMRIKGVMRVDVFECPLNKIHTTCLTFSPMQRLMRVGTIRLTTADTSSRTARWDHLAQPLTVHTRLRNAIARSHMPPSAE